MSPQSNSTKLTQMVQEAFEASSVISAQLHEYDDVVSDILQAVDKGQINGVIICGRGSSSNAGVFGKYLVETYAGLSCALAVPSVNSIYGAS